MVISLSTIRNNAYTTFFDHLQTGTYAISTNNIHTNYSDYRVRAEGYPQIIILSPLITQTGSTMTRSSQFFDINYTIEVYHNSAQNARTFSDEIMDKIDSGRSVFTTAKINNLRVTAEDYEVLYHGPKNEQHKITINWVGRYIS